MIATSASADHHAHDLSIGCWPCTKPVEAGADARSGRWAGMDKSECGIHVERAGAGVGLGAVQALHGQPGIALHGDVEVAAGGREGSGRVVVANGGLQRVARARDQHGGGPQRGIGQRAPVLVGRGQGRGVAHIEAPRGTLIHDYEIDAKGIVRSANMIIATQQNTAAINRSLMTWTRSSSKTYEPISIRMRVDQSAS